MAARLIQTAVAPRQARLSFALRQDKQRQGRKREGRYLLRRKIPTGRSPEEVWPFYSQLTEVEAAFKSLKDDLALRPIHHQLEQRIQAPIFLSFLACCLQVTLRRRLRDRAPGLTPRSVLEKLATMQMLDGHLPTTDERTVILSRSPQPETAVQLLLQRLKLERPAQPPPRITGSKVTGQVGSVVKTEAIALLICSYFRSPTPSNPPSRANGADWPSAGSRMVNPR